jgi:hypothetical protein
MADAMARASTVSRPNLEGALRSEKKGTTR